MFGELLRELRRDRGMTQAELAERLFVSPLTVSSYECGRSTPDDATKIKIAKIFGVSLDYMLGLIREPLPYAREEHTIQCPQNFTAGDMEEVRCYVEFLQYKKENTAPGGKDAANMPRCKDDG